MTFKVIFCVDLILIWLHLSFEVVWSMFLDLWLKTVFVLRIWLVNEFFVHFIVWFALQTVSFWCLIFHFLTLNLRIGFFAALIRVFVFLKSGFLSKWLQITQIWFFQSGRFTFDFASSTRQFTSFAAELLFLSYAFVNLVQLGFEFTNYSITSLTLRFAVGILCFLSLLKSVLSLNLIKNLIVGVIMKLLIIPDFEYLFTFYHRQIEVMWVIPSKFEFLTFNSQFFFLIRFIFTISHQFIVKTDFYRLFVN